MTKYCLDSNFFINAWRCYYSPEITKDFWDWLVVLVEKGEIFIPIEVYEEIEVGKDALYKWIKQIKDKIVVKMDESIQKTLKEIMKFPEAIKMVDSNKKDNNADIFVAAHALNNRSTVVTNDAEILNLCKVCKILYLRDYEFLKEKKLKMSITNLQLN